MKACTQCGRCCTNSSFMGSMEATKADLARWEREGRDDILAYAVRIGKDFADLWIHPQTGEELGRCPFVRKLPNKDQYKCMIYDTRPYACKSFPWNVGHMKFVDCEMLDEGDTDADVARFMRRQPRTSGLN